METFKLSYSVSSELQTLGFLTNVHIFWLFVMC